MDCGNGVGGRIDFFDKKQDWLRGTAAHWNAHCDDKSLVGKTDSSSLNYNYNSPNSLDIRDLIIPSRMNLELGPRFAKVCTQPPRLDLK